MYKGPEWGDGGHLKSYLDLRLFIQLITWHIIMLHDSGRDSDLMIRQYPRLTLPSLPITVNQDVIFIVTE